MKLTKKIYKQAKELFEFELGNVRDILRLAKETDGASLPDIDMWNEYHDREYEIVKSLRDLDFKWETRNWNAGDWDTYSLMCQNVD